MSKVSLSPNDRPTQRAPDWWESARFQDVCVTWSWFRQSGVIPSHPPAGNANHWATPCISQLKIETNNKKDAIHG
jgi:hypothetical protein